ncbi:hypothetical protein, partial [Pelagihabitans pacificus]|uniref:hypothetical protein n=1 Tax=Pelagihabitans pacificus TaxID=2696054 RepID=UPI001EE82906
ILDYGRPIQLDIVYSIRLWSSHLAFFSFYSFGLVSLRTTVGLRFVAVIRPKDNPAEPKDSFLRVISV